MNALGFALLVMGAVLMVAEAHLPGGVLGVAGAIALIAGGVIVIAALGGGAMLAVPVGVGLGGAAGAWAVLAARKAASAQAQRVASGREALQGRIGVVRCWSEPSGQIFVDGALWRARHAPLDADEGVLAEGDAVVVDGVTGLTLSVHRADEWELTA